MSKNAPDEGERASGDEVDTILRCESVTLGYGRPTVLEDVTLAVRPGEFWFWLGPNGSGKSTLLRALLGDVAPRHGAITWRSPAARTSELGYVPQRSDFNHQSPTTAREIVDLGLVGLPLDAPARVERCSVALAQVGLAGKERVSFAAMSIGQRQRVLLARALVRRPRLLLLDEPVSGLDLASASELLRVLAAEQRERALAIVFVTHPLEFAERFATHLALFADRRVQVGKRELLTQFVSHEVSP
ncbi:MAG: metal ABC transporter ATP-binding protein [Planctomycetota bacterium]